MKAEFYEIGDKTILEVFTGTEYEYYVRDTDEKMDCFRFSFGSDIQFGKEGLTVLVESGYFGC